MSSNALIVFGKDPVKGKVKTRLAQTLGNDFANRLYKMCVENTLNELRKLDSNYNVYLFSDSGKLQVNKLNEVGFIFRKQNGNDIGEKMKNSFKEVFSCGFCKAILIGTDIPDISCKIIEKAFNLLDESDVVLGPAKDGGYYLIGMKERYDFLFSGIDWSSREVLSQSLFKVKKKGKRTKILEKLNDIDTKTDLEDWLKNDVDSKFKIIVKSEYDKFVQN
jgi:rSAM/selenodomain-associated transferase 1